MESTKNSDIRSLNRKRLLNLLFRNGQMTKQEMAIRLDISLPTVSAILNELTERGLVTKGKTMESTGGRKAICHMPVFNAKYSIGAEAGRSGLRIAMLDLGGKVVAQSYEKLPRENTREYWLKVNDLIKAFRDKNIENADKLLDIGITLDVPMQAGKALKRKSESLEETMDLQMAMECLDMKVSFRNSTKMSAVAEMWSSNNWNNFVFFSIGKQIRGALVYRENVIDFANMNAEFGEQYVPGGGTVNSLLDIERVLDRFGITEYDTFFERAREDEAVKEAWNEYLDKLAVILYNVHCVFGWEIVLGGPLTDGLEEYRDILMHKINEKIEFEEVEGCQLKSSQLGKLGAVVGAALLPIDNFMDS